MVTPDRKPYAAADGLRWFITNATASSGADRHHALSDLDRLAGLLASAEMALTELDHIELPSHTRTCAVCFTLAKLRAERGEG